MSEGNSAGGVSTTDRNAVLIYHGLDLILTFKEILHVPTF